MLTDREIEVLDLLIEGSSNEQISELLCITKSTVKKHIESIFKELNVHNRVQAAVLYLKMKYKIIN